MELKLPERKKHRLTNHDYSSKGAYFITICSAERRNIFWSEDSFDFVGEDIILPPVERRLSSVGVVVDNAIKQIPEKYLSVAVLQYVIMPNHVHLVIQLDPLDADRRYVMQIIGQMKRYVSKTVGCSVWQKSFYDRVIRNYDEYLEISKYIQNNPKNWKLDELYRASFE